MSLDCILLGLLRQPASGYEVKHIVDQGIAHFWAAELSQIYPALKRLEKRGWLRGRYADSARGAGKRLYRTTGAGHVALKKWLASGPQMGDERFPYVAQVYFMDELGDLRKTTRFLLDLRELVNRRFEALRAIERRWRVEDPRFPDHLPAFDLHVHLTLRLGLEIQAAKLKWCDESIRRVRARSARERAVSGKRAGRSGARDHAKPERERLP